MSVPPVPGPPVARALAHRIEGEGTPVVLLNGGMMTFGSWEPVAALLRERHQVLRFDFRGQLLSPGEPPADLAGHADDLAALLERVGWSSAHLVGASFGAEVAVHLAARHPQRARSLVLVTAMDRVTPEFRRQSDEMRGVLGDVVAGADRGRFYELLLDGVYSEEYRQREAGAFAARRPQIDQLPAAWFEAVDRYLAALESFDLTPLLAAVRAPSLVVIARRDRVMALERSRALAAALGAESAEHPTSGHGLVAEEPVWLARLCLEFLERVDSGARGERRASDTGERRAADTGERRASERSLRPRRAQ